MDQQQQSRWRPTRKQLLWAGAAVGLLTVAILVGYPYGVTLWDWIKLLVVPAVIAGGGIWFNHQQRQRELDFADQRTKEDRKIAQERADTEREIADQRAQDEALQAYLDQMGKLLLDKGLRESKGDEEGPIYARARTLTVLRRLDGERKGRVLRFLQEAGLIDRDHVVVDLMRADLTGADLRKTLLAGAHLRLVDLSGADLSESLMGQTVLEHADLREANLRGIRNWTANQLLPAESFEGATMPDGQILKSDDNPDGPTSEE
jgi:hypothetical protein